MLGESCDGAGGSFEDAGPGGELLDAAPDPLHHGSEPSREALAKRKSTEEMAAKEQQRLETEEAIRQSLDTFDAPDDY